MPQLERSLEVAAPFIAQANALANGLPRLLEGVNLWHVMASAVDDESHLLIALRSGLSGEAHGNHTIDSNKYVVPNSGFYDHMDTMIAGGLWTPDKDLYYPGTVDDAKPIGLSLPGLSNEKVVFSDGEKQADTIIVAGATFDGLLNRISTASELIGSGSEARTIVILSGPRSTEPREGDSERYKQFTTQPEKPIVELYATEYDSAKAIVEGLYNCEPFAVELDKSDEGKSLRGGEVSTYYKVQKDGIELDITVMNGMPVIEKDAMNRPKGKANPRIPVTLEEYIRTHEVDGGVWSYVSSYPHRNRIAIEGIKKVHELGLAGRITIHPQGKMSMPDKVTAGLHMGEVLPVMKNTKELVEMLGLPARLLVSTTDAAARYMQTHYSMNR